MAGRVSWCASTASTGSRPRRLVTRGRLGGKVRRHFAHPPGQAPTGGHGPETVWHITTKHLLAAWARSRPGVDRVRLEQWTEDRDRRADVEVLLRDGTKIALEAQRKLMTDDGWRARHRDYARQGVVDVWFWRPRVHFPHVVLDEGLPVWFYSGWSAAIPEPVGDTITRQSSRVELHRREHVQLRQQGLRLGGPGNAPGLVEGQPHQAAHGDSRGSEARVCYWSSQRRLGQRVQVAVLSSGCVGPSRREVQGDGSPPVPGHAT
ncbi:competence protein CoiA family protein [Streptomyces microflavus]|uniref:competence protein CoiA family protein n=1 Tax=Streptomyces microflavus TaxID=1919 RepID=UPI0037A7930D